MADALCMEMACWGMEYGGACVSVGKNTAEPYHISGDKVIADQSCVWIGFGALDQNCCTDVTAFYFGEPDDEYLRIHSIVNKAREAGIAAAKVGVPLHAVDDAARSVIEAYGCGEFFTHRTRHGIGITNHEGPSAEAGEMMPIAPGMAFSVEPGIYIPGRFGVRIEDQVLIGEDGKAHKLHNYPTELTVFRT